MTPPATTLADSAGETIVRHLAEEPAFVGIGYATAGRPWTRLSADPYRVLGDGDVAALAGVLRGDRAAEPRRIAHCHVFLGRRPGVRRRSSRRGLPRGALGRSRDARRLQDKGDGLPGDADVVRRPAMACPGTLRRHGGGGEAALTGTEPVRFDRRHGPRFMGASVYHELVGFVTRPSRFCSMTAAVRVKVFAAGGATSPAI